MSLLSILTGQIASNKNYFYLSVDLQLSII